MVVALSIKLKSMEVTESHAEHLKQMLTDSEASQNSLRLSLDNLSQQMLNQVQTNRDTASEL